jgi:hypothetical protein
MERVTYIPGVASLLKLDDGTKLLLDISERDRKLRLRRLNRLGRPTNLLWELQFPYTVKEGSEPARTALDQVLESIQASQSVRPGDLSALTERLNRDTVERFQSDIIREAPEEALRPRRQETTGALFLYIPIPRLILLSIASLGIYEAYWIYKNWRFVKERDRLDIRPFWRGMFGVFFCHSLLKRIHADEETCAVLVPSFWPGGLATGWVILIILGNLIGRAPGIGATIIAGIMPSYLFLAPVQKYINSVTERRSPRASYYSWSLGHFVCLGIGVLVWIVLLSLTPA